MTARGWLRRARVAVVASWRRFEPVVRTRRGMAGLFGLALLVYGVESIAWPMAAGRDFGSYVEYYVKMWQLHPVLPESMLWRTPIAPIVIGGSLDFGGGYLLEIVMAVLFAASVVAWTLVARRFGPLPAFVTALILLLYASYAALFHTASSDPIFAAGFAFWALGFVSVIRSPSLWRFALLGLGVAVLVLIRPSNQILLVFALTPLFVAVGWRRRIAWMSGFAVAAAIPLLAFAELNSYRAHDFTIVRGANDLLFMRTYATDKIVSPDNGPNSRELARVVQRRLLTVEPYKSYGITLEQFFSSGSFRMHQDLFRLSDEVWGWNSDHAKLRAVAVEAIERHPWIYTRSVVGSVLSELLHPLYEPAPTVPTAGAATTAKGSAAPKPPTILVNGHRLPKPTEGDLIPAAHSTYSTYDNSVHEVWTSATNHYVVFKNPRDEQRFNQVNARETELKARVPTRSGSPSFALFLNRTAHVFPPPLLWLLGGAVGLVIRRPRRIGAIVGLAVAGLVVLFLTALGMGAAMEYSVPVDPAFGVLLTVALFAPRGRKSLPPTRKRLRLSREARRPESSDRAPAATAERT
jgi:hypothetical protein